MNAKSVYDITLFLIDSLKYNGRDSRENLFIYSQCSYIDFDNVLNICMGYYTCMVILIYIARANECS